MQFDIKTILLTLLCIGLFIALIPMVWTIGKKPKKQKKSIGGKPIDLTIQAMEDILFSLRYIKELREQHQIPFGVLGKETINEEIEFIEGLANHVTYLAKEENIVRVDDKLWNSLVYQVSEELYQDVMTMGITVEDMATQRLTEVKEMMSNMELVAERGEMIITAQYLLQEFKRRFHNGEEIFWDMIQKYHEGEYSNIMTMKDIKENISTPVLKHILDMLHSYYKDNAGVDKGVHETWPEDKYRRSAVHPEIASIIKKEYPINFPNPLPPTYLRTDQ